MDSINADRLYEPRNYPCVVCSKRTKERDRRRLNGKENKHFRKYLYKTYMITVKENDVSCGKCRSIYYRRCKSEFVKKTNESVDDDPIYIPPKKKQHTDDVVSPKNIALPLSSLKGPSHSTCCICKRRGHKFIVVSSDIRYNIFINKNIIIPSGSRCCPGHIIDNRFTDDAESKLSDFKSETKFNRTDIYELIQNIRRIAQKHQNERIDFDCGMNDSDYINLLGINKESFDDICSHIKDVRSTKIRSQRTCVGITIRNVKPFTLYRF